MNKLKTYMKKLNILYIEDEKPAREMFAKLLNRQFENVSICENGLDGYLEYKSNQNKDTKFDLIISDINMPKMSGIELVEKVREEDSEILIILVTARNEASVIMRALELNVTNYLTKPIDMTKTNEIIINTCEKLYLKSALIEKQKQLEVYTKTIEDAALIVKTDANGIITYTNDMFITQSAYSKEDLIEKNCDFIFHEKSETQIKEIWKSVKEGNTWKDTVKSITKDGEVYYSKTTIVPVFNTNDDEIIEFVFIEFITTDEEKRKQELNKKLLSNIVDSKKNMFNMEKEKQANAENINSLNKTIFNYEERMNSLMQTNQSLLTQLEAYETSKLSKTSTHVSILKSKNDEIGKLQKILVSIKNEKSVALSKLEELEETLASKNHLIDFLQTSHKTDTTKISDLESLIRDLEKTSEKKSKRFFNK